MKEGGILPHGHEKVFHQNTLTSILQAVDKANRNNHAHRR